MYERKTYNKLPGVNMNAFNALFYNINIDGYSFEEKVAPLLTGVDIQNIEFDLPERIARRQMPIVIKDATIEHMVIRGRGWQKFHFKNCSAGNLTMEDTEDMQLHFEDCAITNIIGTVRGLQIQNSVLWPQDFNKLIVNSLSIYDSQCEDVIFSAVNYGVIERTVFKNCDMDAINFGRIEFGSCAVEHPKGLWPVVFLGRRFDGYDHTMYTKRLDAKHAVVHMAAGCRNFSYEEGVKHWNERLERTKGEDKDHKLSRDKKSRESLAMLEGGWLRMKALLADTKLRIYKSEAEARADMAKTKPAAASGAHAHAKRRKASQAAD